MIDEDQIRRNCERASELADEFMRQVQVEQMLHGDDFIAAFSSAMNMKITEELVRVRCPWIEPKNVSMLAMIASSTGYWSSDAAISAYECRRFEEIGK